MSASIVLRSLTNLSPLVCVALATLCLAIGSTIAIRDMALDPTLALQQYRLAEQSEHIEQLAQEFQDRINNCKTQPCDINPLINDSALLRQEAQRFRKMVGQERKIASFVGMTELDLLMLHLQQFADTHNHAALRIQLDQDLPKISAMHRRFYIQFETEQYKNKTQTITIFALFLIAAGVLYAIAFMSWHMRSTNKDKLYSSISMRLDQTAQAISDWDTASFKQLLGDSDLSELERRAFSKVLNTEHELDAFRSQMDLYRKLYTMIGFEMRGITTTIKGGLRVLTKDTDDHGVFLAHEISLATDMLEELAENFNRLLSSGQAEGGEFIDISALLANLSSSLSGKIRRYDAKMESYVDPRIPSVVFGNHTGVFWTLLFHFSNAITQIPNKNALLLVRCQSAESIDKIVLSFELMFSDVLEAPLDDVLNCTWADTQSIGSQSVSQQLLNTDANLKVQWLESLAEDCATLSGARKLVVSIDATPKVYPENGSSLEDKRVLLCGDSPLQLDILSRTIADSGCQLDWAKSPNDIFKATAKAQEFDAFIITDTVPGIELKSFCKTLKSRLTKGKGKTRLLLSVADPDLVEDTYEHVDHIFYRPSDNKSFITKLKQQLEQEESEGSMIEQKILVVEDDQIQQIILIQLLEEFGISCDAASSGEEALEYLNEHHPAIVFMDCIMPGMGGIEATRRIRANEDLKEITVIGATALTSNKDKKECMDAGMDYIIGKPYKNDEIYKVIKNYMAVQKIS